LQRSRQIIAPDVFRGLVVSGEWVKYIVKKLYQK